MKPVTFQYTLPRPAAVVAVVTFALLAADRAQALPNGPAETSLDVRPHAVRAEGALAEDRIEVLRARAQAEGSIPVLIALRAAPQARRAGTGDAAMREARRSAQVRALSALPTNTYSIRREYDVLPLVSVEITEEGLARLDASADVAGIFPIRQRRASLSESTRRIRANALWRKKVDGRGFNVAVLDTGVDARHPFLEGAVVHEACFAIGRIPNDIFGGTLPFPQCIDPVTQQIAPQSEGPGTAAPCGMVGCDHGTHVAGIAAGDSANLAGVANGAGIIAVQVFHTLDVPAPREPVASDDDIIRALEHVLALRERFAIAAVNLSLGGDEELINCDFDNDGGQHPYRDIFDRLREAGIATIVATGNEGRKNGVSRPACVSSAISVGATGATSDTVSASSNSSTDPNFPALLAPGRSIFSAVPGGGFASMSGTSMAAPHVAGAFALLRQLGLMVPPADVVAHVRDVLRRTGKPVTDPKNGAVTSRINLKAAAGCVCTGKPSVRAPAVDVTFGPDGNGRTVAAFAGNNDVAFDVAIDSRKRIILGGTTLGAGADERSHDFAIARFNAAGFLDSSFGADGNGKVGVAFGGNDDRAAAIAIGSKDRIVIVGSTLGASATLRQRDFAVARLKSNGRLDRTFGPDRNGKVGIAFSGNDDRANAVAIQPDGKIVVAGSTLGAAAGIREHDMAIARLKRNGRLDRGFGPNADGRNAVAFAGNDDHAHAVAMQGDRILLAGSTLGAGASENERGLAVARLLPNGSLDPTFGPDGNGKLGILPGANDEVAYAMLVQSDQRIVLAGSTQAPGESPKMLVVRLEKDGTIDRSFGPSGNGRVVISVGCDGAIANAIGVDALGRIVVVGDGRRACRDPDWAFARLLANGMPDDSFGVKGVGTALIAGGGGRALGVAIDVDQSIVVAGSTRGAGAGLREFDFGVMRLLP